MTVSTLPWSSGGGHEVFDAPVKEEQSARCDRRCPQLLQGGDSLFAVFVDVGSELIRTEFNVKDDSKVSVALHRLCSDSLCRLV